MLLYYRNILRNIEQNLPQPFLKVLFGPLWQERESKGAAPPCMGVETQHKVRLNSIY